MTLPSITLMDDMDEVESNIFDLELNLIEYNIYIVQETAFEHFSAESEFMERID